MARKKKSNNPFKMKGAWIGVISILIIGVIAAQKNIFVEPLIYLSEPLGMLIYKIGIFGGGLGGAIGSHALAYILTLAPFGFLIGWGIHSLIRRYKK
jgi:hypothetical protein